MKITLAGYNVDLDQLCALLPRETLTPETLTAAYARISRAPDAVDVLRRKARENVSKARASNENIIFKLGHQSIAEHAVFNFDMVDVSRLVIEAIEHSRLCSYTEKSQRYITFDKAKKEFTIPAEISDSGYAAVFCEFVEKTHDAYHFILDRIKKQKRPQGGNAQEDARYVTTLAVTGQLGMTVNARSLALMVRRLQSHPLREAQQVGQALFRCITEVAPSLLQTDQHIPLRRALLDEIRGAINLNLSEDPRGLSCVRLLTAPGNNGEGDTFILATLVHQACKAPFDVCHATVACMKPDMRFSLLRRLFVLMEVHDTAPRQWEMTEMTFEITCSASCFAQLKRHRMATILPQAYDPSLGFVVPESIQKDAEALTRFKEIICDSDGIYALFQRTCGSAVAEYALTQAHRRRVLVKMNARELYAFSRLREDKHAQWEIREIAHAMLHHAQKVMPLTMALACGKDCFEERKTALVKKSLS